MNIPQIPDIEEIKRKMAEANMNFPEPVSYPDQLQAIRDLPPMTQMPTREEIQAAIQNIPTPRPAPQVVNNYTALDPDRALSVYGQRQQDAPMNQMPTREEIQMAMQNMPTPTAPVSSMPKFNLPQMQSFGLPQQIAGGRTLMSDFSPRNVMRMANGGGIDQAIYDLKFKLNG
jgi:hypothetical protein